MSTFPLSYGLGLFQQLFVFTLPRCCASFYLAIMAVAHRGWEVWAGQVNWRAIQTCAYTHTHTHTHTQYTRTYCTCAQCVCVCVCVCTLGCQVCDSWSLCILSRLWLMTQHHDNTGGWDTFIHTKALLGPSLSLLPHPLKGQRLALTPALCAC